MLTNGRKYIATKAKKYVLSKWFIKTLNSVTTLIEVNLYSWRVFIVYIQFIYDNLIQQE